jgi:hypothetical protein
MSDLKIDYGGLRGLIEEGHESAEERAGRKGLVGRLARRVAFWVATALVLATLPFLVLVRVGVYGHAAWGLGGWGAVLLGGAATGAVLSVYAWGMGRRLGGGRTMRRLLTRGAWGVAAAWVVYALVYVAGANVKSPEVRAEYRSLHPLLRLATSAVFVADGETVITDAGRTPEDYWLMGLSKPEASLHFRQEDGFVHALDIRTRGRREWRNVGLEIAFWALGLNTLRHVGTADHLHVSLRSRRR